MAGMSSQSAALRLLPLYLKQRRRTSKSENNRGVHYYYYYLVCHPTMADESNQAFIRHDDAVLLPERMYWVHLRRRNTSRLRKISSRGDCCIPR